jgi:hypothetical protein
MQILNSMVNATSSPKKPRTFLEARHKIAIADEATSKPKNFSKTAKKYHVTLSQVQNYVKQRVILC